MPGPSLAHLRPDHRVGLPRPDARSGVELTASTAGRVSVAGGHLVVDESGSANPPVVLLHGFSFDRSSWDPQFERFAARHRTLRYDLRGFGASGRPVAGRGHVDDLVDLLDERRIARAHLVGLSLGANIALAAAVAQPDRVAGLVLASPGLPGHRWTTPRPPDQAAEHARAFGVEAGRRFWLEHEMFASTVDHPEVRAGLDRMVANFAAWQWTDGPQTDPLPALNERLGDVRAPTLVVHGRRDVAGYREIARVIAAGVPGAQRHELPTAGHLVNLEHPDEFNTAVLDFLASVRS